MNEAVEEGLMDQVVGLLDMMFSTEGAVRWLLDANPLFEGKSAAYLLLNDEGEAVLETLRSFTVEA